MHGGCIAKGAVGKLPANIMCATDLSSGVTKVHDPMMRRPDHGNTYSCTSQMPYSQGDDMGDWNKMRSYSFDSSMEDLSACNIVIHRNRVVLMCFNEKSWI